MSKKIDGKASAKYRARNDAHKSSVMTTIRLTPEENEAALKAGDGNRSEGLRVALAHYVKKIGGANE